MSTATYRRILLKLSGEYLSGQQGYGLDPLTLQQIARTLKQVQSQGIQIGLVVGGGNFWRGRSSGQMDRITADQIGMLATTMNALALADALRQEGLDVRVQSALQLQAVAEPFIAQRAIRHLEKGRLVIFACGTGSPFFTTDSAAALRAAEIEASVLLKATNVDGVYDSDPRVNPTAKRYDHLTHDEVLQKRLGVMDATAAALCRDNHIDILVFDLSDPQNLIRVLAGEPIATCVTDA